MFVLLKEVTAVGQHCSSATPNAAPLDSVDGVHKWKDAERDELRAELDAAYAILYGVEAGDLEYMLSTFQGMTDAERAAVLLAYEGLRSHELMG
ncbi:MAG: hypothetical protein ACIAS6_15110 [Phycisphaerales bacterium JB060]